MADVSGKIAQANGRLKSAKLGIKIEQLNDRLYLRATLPPKPDSGKNRPYQQRISLGIYANPAGVSAAEKEARAVAGLLASGEFSWEPYTRRLTEQGAGTVGEWVEKFEKDYFSKRDRNPKSETTWKGDYLKVYKTLPQDQALTSELLQNCILKTDPDTKTRKRAVMACSALAKFAGLVAAFSAMAGNYSPKRVSPRDLPTDEQIALWWSKIPNSAWRWVYGAIAVYGLRPHEAFRLDFEELRQGSIIATVLEGKTGSRRVWPCYPEWVETFAINDVQLPGVDLTRSNTGLGESASKQFWEYKLPFKLYDLRHCWAIRTLEFGLDISLAAQQMGHSVAVHSETYHHWISDRHHQRAFELLMMRSDRPKPPNPSPQGVVLGKF